MTKDDTPKDREPQKRDKATSYAQVAPFVGQQNVRPKPCELKLGEVRTFKITARFASGEREFLVRQAEFSCLTVSEYIRASALGPGYAATIDPAKRDLLKKISRELGHQGNNLNQIARHLNAGIASMDQGNSMLAIIARSLLSAHKSVREALAEGRKPT